MNYVQLLAGARIGRFDTQPPNEVTFDGFKFVSRVGVLRFKQITVPDGSIAVQFFINPDELGTMTPSDLESKISSLRIVAGGGA